MATYPRDLLVALSGTDWYGLIWRQQGDALSRSKHGVIRGIDRSISQHQIACDLDLFGFLAVPTVGATPPTLSTATTRVAAACPHPTDRRQPLPAPTATSWGCTSQMSRRRQATRLPSASASPDMRVARWHVGEDRIHSQHSSRRVVASVENELCHVTTVRGQES